MTQTSSHEPIPSDGERNALVGYSAQFELAAKIVYRYVPTLQWIRVADPSAGVADDFQFFSSGRRHALQVKWSQFPTTFKWSDLFGTVEGNPSLFTSLAAAWKRLRAQGDEPLTVHLCTNNFASTATPTKGTALATAADAPKHFAGFLARSFGPIQTYLRHNPTHGWSDIASLNLVTTWADAWTAIKDAADLTHDDFTQFLRDFDIAFIPLDQSELLAPDAAQDHRHLAATLQATVVDPQRIVKLDRAELMAKLGWSSRTQYQNPHRFPVPDTYTANSAARTALEDALKGHHNGYLALIGPPGSGKSTLVETVSVPGRLVRYYAFIPDAPDPLNGRGEADSFMHDLSLALEEAGIYRKGFGSDLAGQRAVLFNQLAQAGETYVKDGTRTTIVVDGLDHIPREQTPTRSLLHELPPPAALPPGVCIVLGSQTTSILPTPISQALSDDTYGTRIVEVPPLAPGEIETIATMAGVTDWLLPGQLNDLVDISEGHPLVLTYMIQDLRELETEHDEDARHLLAGHMLTDAAEHQGSIDQRYARYLGSLAQDDDNVFAILGTVCRLRVPINLEWLETWVDAAAVTRFADRTHTFFRREGHEWTFIHNSFRRFLVDQTATVAGQIRDSRSRELHAELADRCAASSHWPQYQDEELAQRYLAGQFQQVLDVATPQRLRDNLFAGRPPGVVRDQTVIAIRSAAEAGDHRALNRSLMFLNELNQRGYVIDAETMAEAMSYIAPELAVEHVVQGRTLRVKTPEALKVAATMAANDSIEAAEAIMRAVGGLQGITSNLERSNGRLREWAPSVADWAEVIWHRSGLDRVLDELDHLLPFPPPVNRTTTPLTTPLATDAAVQTDNNPVEHDTTTPPTADPGTVPVSCTGSDPDASPAADVVPGVAPDESGATPKASSNPYSEGTAAATPVAASADSGDTGDTGDTVVTGGTVLTGDTSGTVVTSDTSGTVVTGGTDNTGLSQDQVQVSAENTYGLGNEDWKAERALRESREARAAVIGARNAVHARCFDLANTVRDNEAMSRLAERINNEASLDWRARMHVVAARTAQEDGDAAEAVRQAQLLLQLEEPAQPEALTPDEEKPTTTTPSPDTTTSANPAAIAVDLETDHDTSPTQADDTPHTITEPGSQPDDNLGLDDDQGDDDDDDGVDEEEASPCQRRINLNLRAYTAVTLALAGQAHSDEFQALLPPETQLAWPDYVGSDDGLDSYRTILLVQRARELHNLIGIYDAIPASGLAVAGSTSDPARTRFQAALTVVAKLEAQAIAALTGLADNPDIPAFTQPVIRVLELPLSTTRDWTGWHRIPDAAIELIADLVPLARKCGGTEQLERLLAQLTTAWHHPDRATYWPASRRITIIRAAARYPEATDWCRTELAAAKALVADEGDPYSRATTWLDCAKVHTELSEHDNAFETLTRAHQDGWGPGQHRKDYQLVSWLSWLIEAADREVIDQTTFLNDACTYAARLIAATDEANHQASEAAANLITAVFKRDPALATTMAETLCDATVISEPDLITALLKGATESEDVDPELPASLLTELLMPLTPDTPHDLEEAILTRATDTVELTTRFAQARSLWSVPDTRTNTSNNTTDTETTGTDTIDAATPTAEPPDQTDNPQPLTLPAMLGQMRAADASIPPATAQQWSDSLNQHTGPAPRAVATAVLEQTQRLRLADLDVARAAGIASRAGATEPARDALSHILARTTPYGWLRNWDGGSRYNLFEAAITDEPTDDIVDLAARDLAGLVASKAIAGEFYPSDLQRFAELFGGTDLVAQCWSDIRDYLDVFAPATTTPQQLQPNTTTTRPEQALIGWAAQQLGHPIRIIDFGARRFLANNHTNHRNTIESALTNQVTAGGWPTEAALHVLVRVSSEATDNAARHQTNNAADGSTQPALTLSPALQEALQHAATSPDAINRHLATQTLTLNHQQPHQPPNADLPFAYLIELPPLPKRERLELDQRGVPFVDTSDPRQTIAPYDEVLRGIAKDTGIEARNLHYRAASLGQGDPNNWTDGGHNTHYERLARRGTRHVYRPWAYMTGRRGCAHVIAELIDANALPHGLNSPWFHILVDDALNWISPHPLDDTTPLPWRAPNSKDYASQEWCDQAQPAANNYATQAVDNHILSETSEWRWLTWDTPTEIRRTRTHHKRTTGTILLNPPSPTTETTVYDATRYPYLPDLEWATKELTVRGISYHSDPERAEWQALHPAIAVTLGWEPTATQFEWAGTDGNWRARSILRVRGQLSHKPPSDATCAEAWQVILSNTGWQELTTTFPELERTIRVNRILKQNRRNPHDRLEDIATATVPDTTS